MLLQENVWLSFTLILYGLTDNWPTISSTNESKVTWQNSCSILSLVEYDHSNQTVSTNQDSIRLSIDQSYAKKMIKQTDLTTAAVQAATEMQNGVSGSIFKGPIVKGRVTYYRTRHKLNITQNARNRSKNKYDKT